VAYGPRIATPFGQKCDPKGIYGLDLFPLWASFFPDE
jgi:hypothetical protein